MHNYKFLYGIQKQIRINLNFTVDIASLCCILLKIVIFWPRLTRDGKRGYCINLRIPQIVASDADVLAPQGDLNRIQPQIGIV
jgi:hypothetical protein